MGIAFDRPGDTATRALRRVARRELRQATERIAAGTGPADLALTIHETRKAIKRLRALLRLVGPALPGVRSENANLRDIARRLSDLRDADVAIATLAAIDPAGQGFPGLHAALSHRVARDRNPADAAGILADAARDLAALRKRAGRWRVAGKGFTPLAKGLARSHDGARAGLAALDGTPGALHRWRKRIKDMHYQLRLLAPLWPAATAPRIAAADTLGELLGDHNDLTMLAMQADALTIPVAERMALAAAIADRQGAIMAAARPLGRLLCAGPGKAHAAIWADLWNARRDWETAPVPSPD